MNKQKTIQNSAGGITAVRTFKWADDEKESDNISQTFADKRRANSTRICLKLRTSGDHSDRDGEGMFRVCVKRGQKDSGVWTLPPVRVKTKSERIETQFKCLNSIIKPAQIHTSANLRCILMWYKSICWIPSRNLRFFNKPLIVLALLFPQANMTGHFHLCFCAAWDCVPRHQAGEHPPGQRRPCGIDRFWAQQRVPGGGGMWRRGPEAPSECCQTLTWETFVFSLLQKERTYSFCGTIEYMAPEIIRGKAGHGKVNTGRSHSKHGVSVERRVLLLCKSGVKHL